MACGLANRISLLNHFGCAVQMEHFTSPEKLQGAINCSLKCTPRELLHKGHASIPLYCPIHPQNVQDLLCEHCTEEICKQCASIDHTIHLCAESSTVVLEERRRLRETLNSVTKALEEMKQNISGVKEMRQRVKNRENNNITVTREVFAALRKVIDDREEQMISNIKEAAVKRQKALELQLEELVLLWSQLKNCLELIKKTREEGTVKVIDLINRRKILEQRTGNLMIIKAGLKLEPVRKEQIELKFQGVNELHETINKLGLTLDPNKCEAAIPTMVESKDSTVMITVKDINNDPITDSSEDLTVSVRVTKRGKAMEEVNPVKIKEVGGGRYQAVFMPTRCGHHMISIQFNGHHISGSPHKILVDRDYGKITEQHCCQVVTCYGRNKFSRLSDVTVGPNDEVIIVDNGNKCLIVLDCQFNLLRVVGQGSSTHGSCRLIDPVCVAVNNNIVAVSDQGTHQIKKYTLQGKFLSVIGCHGDQNGQFDYPAGLAFNNDKLLYVVDGGNCRVQVFQQNDKFAFSFGKRGSCPGRFQFPVRIAIDPSNNILVSDYVSSCIHLFNHSGHYIHKIDCHGHSNITVSPTGYILTSHETDNNMITIWSPTHQLLHQFGKEGSQQGKFHGIRGMAIGSTGDIYIVEGDNRRLQVISSN